MKTLPYDYLRCPGVGCDRAQQCARYTSPHNPDGFQPIAYYSSLLTDPRAVCEAFISNEAPE